VAYTKTNWIDRAVEYARRYAKTGETGTEVTLTPSPGTVTQEGTPVNAANMNKIESGIEAAGFMFGIKDTRAINSPPSFYAAFESFRELKISDTIGIVNLSPTFVMLETFRPWSDDSGGKIFQIATHTNTGKVFTRDGSLGTDSWGVWELTGDHRLAMSISMGAMV
jgi:hypothetical protein